VRQVRLALHGWRRRRSVTLRAFKMPETQCPSCGHPVSHAGMDPGKIRERGPQPGDYAMCIRCLALGTYDNKMQLQPFDMSTLSIPAREQIEEVRAYLKSKRD